MKIVADVFSRFLRTFIRGCTPETTIEVSVNFAAKESVRRTLCRTLFPSLVFWLSGGMALAEPATIHRFDEIALSQLGDQVASVEGTEVEDSNSPGPSKLLLRPSKAGPAARLVEECADCSYSGLAFSPAGDHLAYVRSDRKGHASLVVWDKSGPQTLVSVEGLAAAPKWAPDARSLAILVTLSARKQSGPLEAGVRLVGEIGENEDRQRIAIVSVKTHELRLISPSNLFVFDYDWIPDGSGLVASATEGNGDDNWYIAKILLFDATSGAIREIAAPHMQLSFPRVSQDGTKVAFIGGLMSDYGCVGGDIYTVSIAGGELKNLTPGYDGSFTSVAWAKGALLTTAVRRDKAELSRIDVAKGSRQDLWSAPINMTTQKEWSGAFFSARGDRVAAISEGFDHGPEIIAGNTNGPVNLTHDNETVKAAGAAKSVTWSNEGYNVQGWLISPTLGNTGEKHPMVVDIHGGPACHVPPAVIWTGWKKSLLEKGYFLFRPNYRGSLGQGEAFKRSIVLTFGKGELRDILSGVDAVERIAPIDDGRVGVTGHSNGGYLTMWAVTQTGRFKVAVAAAGLANWTSYYGQNGIDKWLLPYFGGSAYDQPEAYRAASPIEFVKQVKTPTLMYVGERDIECPPAQSMEFWHALKELGVPTTLVIYQDEGHELQIPEHLRDVDSRMVAWFDKYLH
jgi:dipeptidyl aminopeptidase/acylaminoacyl peptidase